MLEFWSVRITYMCLWTVLQKTTACNPAATFVWKSFTADSIAQVHVATKYKEIHNRCVNQIPEEPQPPSLSFSVNCVWGFLHLALLTHPMLALWTLRLVGAEYVEVPSFFKTNFYSSVKPNHIFYLGMTTCSSRFHLSSNVQVMWKVGCNLSPSDLSMFLVHQHIHKIFM